MDKRTVIYFEDELNEEFSTFTTTPPKITSSYDYERKSLGKRISRFFLYRIVMYPMVVFYGRVVFGQKIIGKEKLKKYPSGLWSARLARLARQGKQLFNKLLNRSASR